MSHESICWVVNQRRAIKVTIWDGSPWVTENGSSKEYPKVLTCGVSGRNKGYLLLAADDEVVNMGGGKVSFTPNVPVIGNVVIG